MTPSSSHLSSPRTCLIAALCAGVAALVTAAVLAGAGSAQVAGQTFQLNAHGQPSVGFMPKGAPRQGDRFGFGDTITGSDTGTDRGVCTFIGKAAALCTVQVQLSKGTISAQGLLGQNSHNAPVAVTGGTGAYDGARGTASVTDLPGNRSHIVVTLLP
jgi:allene oxide cyclase-like protein